MPYKHLYKPTIEIIIDWFYTLSFSTAGVAIWFVDHLETGVKVSVGILSGISIIFKMYFDHIDRRERKQLEKEFREKNLKP